jgi:hypothetical protein
MPSITTNFTKSHSKSSSIGSNDSYSPTSSLILNNPNFRPPNRKEPSFFSTSGLPSPIGANEERFAEIVGRRVVDDVVTSTDEEDNSSENGSVSLIKSKRNDELSPLSCGNLTASPTKVSLPPFPSHSSSNISISIPQPSPSLTIISSPTNPIITPSPESETMTGHVFHPSSLVSNELSVSPSPEVSPDLVASRKSPIGFKVVKILGSGSFSTVVLAEKVWKEEVDDDEFEKDEDDLVAIKLIDRDSWRKNSRMKVSVVRELEVLKVILTFIPSI